MGGGDAYAGLVPAQRLRHRPRPAGVALGLVVTALGMLGAWAVWRYFVATTSGQLLDEAAIDGSEIGRGRLWRFAEPVLEVISVPFIVAVLGAAAIIAIARRRWVLAVQVAVLVGGANVTTQLLKYVVLERPDAGVGESVANTLPSGHTTVAASIAFALVLLVPPRWRAFTAVVAAGIATFTGVATMVGGWHRPSDVVAAMFVVLAWAGLMTVATALLPPERGADELSAGIGGTIAATVLIVVGAGAGLVAAQALSRTDQAIAQNGPELQARSDLATAYGGGAVGVIAATALSMAALLIAYQSASRPSIRHREEAPL